MKKTRILALVLALALLVSLLPMSAFAISVGVIGTVYEDNNAKITDDVVAGFLLDVKEDDASVTVNAQDYAVMIASPSGSLYDLVGMHVMNTTFMENLDKTPIKNDVQSVTIVASPSRGDFATDEEYNAAFEAWNAVNGETVYITYGPHTHVCTGWISDNTNHWKICLKCNQWFLLNNWHYDGDKDGKCDVCQFEIVYYDISVAEFEGGSIEIEGAREDGTAAYNDKITVTVEAEDGYEIKDVRFYKVRTDGLKFPIMYDVVEAGHVYDCVIQNYDTEIVVIAEKK